jgi:hypothetical protein
VATLALLLTSAVPSDAAIIDFSGIFAPGNWTVDPGVGDGSATFSGGPPETTLDLVGSDTGSGSQIVTLVEITIPAGPSWFLSFSWDFSTLDFPSFDPAGYSVNGSQFQLSDDFGLSLQSGSVSGIQVNPGDTFAFYVDSEDDIFGAATLTVGGFVAETPEPSTVGMVVAGLSLLGLGSIRRRV